MKFVKTLLSTAIFLFYASISYSQMTYVQTGLTRAKYKSDNLTFWDLNMNGSAQVSIIDNWIRKDKEAPLRFGDALGFTGGVGFGKVKEYDTESNKWKMMVDLGYSYGGFVGYKAGAAEFYYKYQIEKFVTHSSKTYTNYSLVSAVSSFVLVIRDKYQFEYGNGTGMSKSDIEDDDKLNRFTFKSYYDDGGDIKNYMGLTLEYYNKNSSEVHINTINFIGGFTF